MPRAYRKNKRLIPRTAGGRFRKATMRDFGIGKVIICKYCRRFNPVALGEPRPEKCHACGRKLVDITE